MAAGSNRTVWNPLSILSACPPLLRCGEDGFGFLVSRFQFLIPGLGYRTTSLGQCPDHVSALLCSSLCTAPRVCSSLRGHARMLVPGAVCYAFFKWYNSSKIITQQAIASLYDFWRLRKCWEVRELTSLSRRYEPQLMCALLLSGLRTIPSQ